MRRLSARGWRAGSTRVDEAVLPLIDVVFFLLVFFLLIGRMDATAPFTVVPPTAETGADLPAGGATIAIGATGRLALDGDELAEAEILAALARRLGAEPALRIRLQADATARLRHLLPLMEALERLGARDVVLVVTPSGG